MILRMRFGAKPKIQSLKDDERLFHLDGYYKWGHALHGMFFPEPSYDDTRARVIKVLENKKEK